MALQTPRPLLITAAVAVLACLVAATPWIAGQLIGWKVQRQLTLMDSHPALSVLESHWEAGYSEGRGYAIIAERVGCGIRACTETRVEFAAQHLRSNPWGWGRVVATADLNGLLNNTLTPPVAPLNIIADVGWFGKSHLRVQISPSWHELHAERADAIAFSGIYADFDAQDYARNWYGDLDASFTVITESASPDQKARMGEIMQSLGTQSAPHSEQVGAVIVRVVALMKELSTAILVWQGKERAWKPQINTAEPLNAVALLNSSAVGPNTIKPLKLELTPDVMVVTNNPVERQVALELPSFEAWHGDTPMPAVAKKLGPATYEEEPELEIWQLNLQFRGDKISLNGLALWRER